ncbi:lytic transglycosylase domain-containing protein, partial [uncultured Nitratireductor sp.]|uniref:lytic transglycosylase domain-containing protein n=1 Tax=uncultured Nitratireductor sp. TaxID=520953 RepID=UPI0025E00FD2
IRGRKNAEDLLDAVPDTERSAGYTFARTRFLRRAGRFEEAAELMLTAPRDANSLIDPDEWWVERRVLSRELLDIGDAETAYRVAAAHSAESPSRAADAEFHAGWYALRFLKNPEAAARHFARIAEIAEGPISSARANYWLGRTAGSGGPGDATAYYEKAARLGATFYGQLATAKLDRTTLAAEAPEPDDDDRRRFFAREMVRAIRSLEGTNHLWRAGSLYRKLAQELQKPGELSLLADMAEARGDYTTALRVGKIAASRGLDIGALAHPVGAIPAAASIPSARQALAYAVARQETEFNAAAVSPAGARGLLQLMPATAREMARKSGLPYSRARLTTDPTYNVTLGAAYLEEQLGRFDGSYILTFAGYNAGPSRASEWMERYGDPRGKPVEEIVDWIERIPYSEPRNYVQRVMENLQVYKMRLTGRFDIVTDLAAGS